ncbi:hypothetical protein ACWCQQ_26490 [Streptomyces sp. NPDC002143]
MTALGGPAQGLPVFYAWFPEVDVAGDEVRCVFDVAASGEVFLNEATSELCQHIAGRLGIHVREIQGWDVQRICTPFYTQFPDSEDWLDRYHVSWRMSIHLRGAVSAGERDLGPIPISVSDPTWRRVPSFWVPGVEECEVLAIEVAKPGSGAVAELSALLSERFPNFPILVEEMSEPKRVVRIGRIRIGRLAVGEEYERLDAVRSACAEMGLATSIPRFELLRARVG